MKILAVDYGDSRTGLATCDHTEFLTTPITPQITHQAAIHNPKFDFNDEILPLAVCFLSEIARSRLTELTH